MTDGFARPRTGDTPPIDPCADAELDKLGAVATGHGPISDITASDGVVAVTNYGDNSVTLIDTERLAVASTVAVGGEPLSAVIADDRLYVGIASASYDAVAVVDTATNAAVATHPLAFAVTAMAAAPDGKHVVVGRTGRDRSDIAVIDTTSDDVTTIDIAAAAGSIVDAIGVSPDGQRIYAAVSETYVGNLFAVDADAARVVASIPVGAPIRDVAVSPDGSAVYVLTYDPRRGGAVAVIDAASCRISADIAIGGLPTGLTLSPDGTRAYVVDRDQVAVICTVTHDVLDAITVGGQPSCVAASPDCARLYVADYGGVVTVFSVAPATTLPRFQVMADVIDVPDVRDLEPAAV